MRAFIQPRVLPFGIIFAMLLSGCQAQDQAQPQADPVWVYAQFNVPEEEGYMETYWYYGSVDGDQFQAISANEISSGFITLKDVHYWGENDVIDFYEDQIDTGDITFRIEHLIKFNSMKAPLEKGFSYSENTDLVDSRPDVEPPPSPTPL